MACTIRMLAALMIVFGIFPLAAHGEITTLEVLGWSRDSQYFAFGQWGPGPREADCNEPHGSLFIVDAAKNDFAKTFRHTSSGPCPTTAEHKPDLGWSKVRSRAEASLKQFGFGKKEPHTLLFDFPKVKYEMGKIVATNRKQAEFTFQGKPYGFQIRQENKNGDECSAAKFEIFLMGPDGNKRSLQKDNRFFRKCGYPGSPIYAGDYCRTYNLVQGYVSPDGRYVSVIIEAIGICFEDESVRYLVVTGLLAGN